MTTNYSLDPNKRGVNGYGQQFCDTVFSATLVAGADTALPVPSVAAMGATSATQFNKFLACISCDNAADVFVALNATATVPPGGAFAATSSELVPRNTYFAKLVKTTDVLHFVSPGTPSVTVAFYAIQEG